MLSVLVFLTEAYFDISLSLALQFKQMHIFRFELVKKFFTRAEDLIQSVIAFIFALFIVGLIVFNLFIQLRYPDEDKKGEVMRKKYKSFFEGLKYTNPGSRQNLVFYFNRLAIVLLLVFPTEYPGI